MSDQILQAMHQASAQLERMGIRYVVIGGLAVGAYGAPRATKDVDFLVGEEAFVHYGPIVSFRAGLPIFSGGINVDPVSIGVDEEFLVKAFEHPAVSRGVPIIAIEPLIYLKLAAGRRHDIDDVAKLMAAGIDERPVRKYLQKNAPTLVPLFDRCLEG